MRHICATYLSFALAFSLFQASYLHWHAGGGAPANGLHNHSHTPFVHSHGSDASLPATPENGDERTVTTPEHQGKALDVFRTILESGPVQPVMVGQSKIFAPVTGFVRLATPPVPRIHGPPEIRAAGPRSPPLPTPPYPFA